MKKIVAFALCLILLVPSIRGGSEVFSSVISDSPGQFIDVSEGSWYYTAIGEVYRLGLMKGITANQFEPEGTLSVAQAITMAARLNSLYHGSGDTFVQGSPWYQVYVDYALTHGILSGEYADCNRPATRAEFAVILAAALPEEALTAINIIEAASIPDVPVDAAYSESVYTLYRAGVLTGNDDIGTFTPDTDIQRCAAAAILVRMADPGQRHSFTLTTAVDTVMNQYINRYGFGEYTVSESRRHDTWETAQTVEMSHTVPATLVDDGMDVYRFSCLGQGRLRILLVTDATGTSFDDLLLLAEDDTKPGGFAQATAGTLAGQNTLTIEIDVSAPRDITFALLSNYLALEGSIYVEYAVYCLFIPIDYIR